MKKFIILLIFILFAGCGTFKDVGKVLRNEKTTTTYEFLVKKKEPLVLPPNYNELPEPDSLKNKEIGEDEEKTHEKKVQTITDDHINSVDQKVLLKEKEIMTI